MAIMKSEDFIFIFAVIILATKTANAVDEKKTSFVEQIDTASKESSVNDKISQSAPVTYKGKVRENSPENLTSPSATDQISTLGFGFVTTVLTLFFTSKINIIT